MPIPITTSTEDNNYYDTEFRSTVVKELTSTDSSITISGKSNIGVAYMDLLQLLSEKSVTENLCFKWMKVGPSGFNEERFGFALLSSYTPEEAANTTVKYSTELSSLGLPYRKPHFIA